MMDTLAKAHAAVCSSVGFGSTKTSKLKPASGVPFAEGDVYQFGVFHGGSLSELVKLYRRPTWGFDAFNGLPHERAGEARVADWRPGAFRANPDAVLARLRRLNKFLNTSSVPVQLIRGVYRDALTDSLASDRGMRPAAYIDVDCDLFGSTLDALDWCFRSGLVQVGTVIGYDAQCLTQCMRFHYNLHSLPAVCQPCPHCQPCTHCQQCPHCQPWTFTAGRAPRVLQVR